MRIINIKSKLAFGIWLSIGYWVLTTVVLPGCAQENPSSTPQGLLKESQAYYIRATDIYKKLIARGEDLDRLYLELGKVYFNHGELPEAREAFKKSEAQEAKKFLAIVFYRLGNFTDALEAFNRCQASDAEYLYYYGLTSEKLNLFDQALAAYKKIKDKEFNQKAKERIEIIEKEAQGAYIKDINSQTSRILARAPRKEKYPQAGALILSCDEKIEVRPDNTQVVYMHYLIKILNERGKQDFSETHVEYDSTYEKVELEYARTIRPDGKVVEVGTRHIRDVSRYLNFPLYSNARVYIISFPEVAEGAAIEYKLKILRNQLINKKDFVLSYPVQAQEPVIAAEFYLSLPKDRPLHLKTINEKYNYFAAGLEPAQEEDGGNLIYRWRFKDIPQIVPESDMPPAVQINPSILISTFNKWEDIYRWWGELSKDKIKADSAIKHKVKELAIDGATEEDKARAIYNFCAQKIRYVAVEYGQAGYEPHKAEDIFRNKYGDCKDQAILLVTMLREAGLTAWPVLIATKEYYNLNADFPATLFNHCIAAVSLKERIIFLDPTAETCSFGDLPSSDQARRVLIFKEDRYEIGDTPMYAAKHNFIKQELKLKIDRRESVDGEKSISSHGIYDQAQRFWLLYTQPELIQDTLKKKIQDISIGAKLINYSVNNLDNLNKTVILNYAFKGEEYFTVAGPLRIMPQLASLDTSLVAKERRKYPIDFDILDSREMILDIEIPGDFMIKYMPERVEEESPWLRFFAEYTFKDEKISFRQKTELRNNLIKEEDYPQFKEFFEGLAKKIKQRVVLERVR